MSSFNIYPLLHRLILALQFPTNSRSILHLGDGIFLDLVAAESLVVLVISIFPNFAISLALVTFANGL
ncbi:hypothetical protein PITC_059840 [Penicillium italicum]|uniref:Uncharacterized protein n=1 Tax=Penicillium italicum TaxID=40296 RepID=A0A0A2LC74_PENIT|nr:hypothetical protein PITC_059840 [Penicillium italicum]